jgi:hypothetical protein
LAKIAEKLGKIAKKLGKIAENWASSPTKILIVTLDPGGLFPLCPERFGVPGRGDLHQGDVQAQRH